VWVPTERVEVVVSGNATCEGHRSEQVRPIVELDRFTVGNRAMLRGHGRGYQLDRQTNYEEGASHVVTRVPTIYQRDCDLEAWPIPDGEPVKFYDGTNLLASVPSQVALPLTRPQLSR